MGGYFSSPEQRDKFPLEIRNISKHKYGWKPDLPDQRDIWAKFPEKVVVKDFVDLRENMPEVYDQGQLGSCTANALCGAFVFDLKKQNLELFNPSRLFVYFNERAIENTIDYDSGASLRDGIRVLDTIGVCKEEFCPYDIGSFKFKPTDQAYEDAKLHKAVKYRRIRPIVEDFKMSLSLGYPVVFGFSVYESFESPDVERTGIMPMPKPGEKILGGHAVVACGYDDKYILVRNSWSSDWGQGGYFWMPYKFLNPRNCSDSWLIEKIKTEDSVKLEKMDTASVKSARYETARSEHARSEPAKTFTVEKSESVYSFKEENYDSD
jgi:C1A family cysteine protease